jgi:predicted Zn-dependent protease
LRRAELALRELALEALGPGILDTGPMVTAVDEITAFLRGNLETSLPNLKVVVLESDQMNAFAFPGDLVVIHDGLVAALESPEQLAAVIAHELGHVVHRDSMRTLSRRLITAAVLGTLVGQRTEALVQRTLAELVNQRYSQEIEARADEFATRLLTAAGLGPEVLAEVLEHLRESGRADLPGVLKYLQSHPGWEERIAAARAAAVFEGARTRSSVPESAREAFYEALRSYRSRQSPATSTPR